MTGTNVNTLKCMSKSEMAEKLGICPSTLQKWLNHRYFKELAKLGYQRSQRLLLPAQVKYLVEQLVMVED